MTLKTEQSETKRRLNQQNPPKPVHWLGRLLSDTLVTVFVTSFEPNGILVFDGIAVRTRRRHGARPLWRSKPARQVVHTDAVKQSPGRGRPSTPAIRDAKMIPKFGDVPEDVSELD